jgi:hypothetical protein
MLVVAARFAADELGKCGELGPAGRDTQLLPTVQRSTTMNALLFARVSRVIGEKIADYGGFFL